MPSRIYIRMLRARVIGLIAVLLLFISAVGAQDKWTNYFTSFGISYELIEECGDTVIRDKNYTILTLTWYDWRGEEVYISGTFGYKRETEDSVIILRAFDNPDSSEYLLYAYNVAVGDTINLDMYYVNGGDFVVEKVDTIAFLGEQRRRVCLRQILWGYEDIWIEGIGTIIAGYLWRGTSPTVIDGGSEFSCYYSSKYDTTWAPYDSLPCLIEMLDSSACEKLTSSTVPVASTTVTLFPNPFSWEAHIVGIPFPCKLAVYDLSGRLVMQSHVDDDETTINTAQLANGMYYIVLIPERGNPITIKAIKI